MSILISIQTLQQCTDAGRQFTTYVRCKERRLVASKCVVNPEI